MLEDISKEDLFSEYFEMPQVDEVTITKRVTTR